MNQADAPSEDASLLSTKNLFLFMLLYAPKGKKIADLRKTLAKAFARDLSGEEVGAEIAKLIADGLGDYGRNAKGKPTASFMLTDKGRETATKLLGGHEVPKTWAKFCDLYLVPLTLGISLDAVGTRTQIASAAKLKAFLLKRHFDLPTSVKLADKDILEAFVCRELGFPNATTFAELQTAVMRRRIDPANEIPAKKLKDVFVQRVLGVSKSGSAALRDHLLQRKSEASATSVPAAFDLSAFAAKVLQVAGETMTGRFTPQRVFINHVWNNVKDQPLFAGFTLDTFKERLLEANQARKLNLVRCDLADLAADADVAHSCITTETTTLHLINLEFVP